VKNARISHRESIEKPRHHRSKIGRRADPSEFDRICKGAIYIEWDSMLRLLRNRTTIAAWESNLPAHMCSPDPPVTRPLRRLPIAPVNGCAMSERAELRTTRIDHPMCFLPKFFCPKGRTLRYWIGKRCGPRLKIAKTNTTDERLLS